MLQRQPQRRFGFHAAVRDVVAAAAQLFEQEDDVVVAILHHQDTQGSTGAHRGSPSGQAAG